MAKAKVLSMQAQTPLPELKLATADALAVVAWNTGSYIRSLNNHGWIYVHELFDEGNGEVGVVFPVEDSFRKNRVFMEWLAQAAMVGIVEIKYMIITIPKQTWTWVRDHGPEMNNRAELTEDRKRELLQILFKGKANVK